MAQKIRRCANPECNKRLPPKSRPDREFCDDTCGTAVRRQRLKDRAAAESIFTPSDIVSFDTQRATNLARDYAISATNLQDIAKEHGIKVVVLPAATGVLVVSPATNRDDCRWFQVDWRQGMFGKWWQVPVDQHAMSTDPDVTDFVNTVQGKDRIKHRGAIDNILTGPARRCIFLTLTRLPPLAAAPRRPFWPQSAPGPKDRPPPAPRKTAEIVAAERTAKQIQESIEADFRRREFATSRREAGYARRKYPR